MRDYIVIIFMMFSQSVFSQKDKIEIDSLYLTDIDIFIEEIRCIKEIQKIEVNKDDIYYLNSLLERSKVKKIRLFKPASEVFYGVIKVADDQTNKYLRIHRGLIYYSGNGCYYFPREKKDKEWLDLFFEKYKKQFHP